MQQSGRDVRESVPGLKKARSGSKPLHPSPPRLAPGVPSSRPSRPRPRPRRRGLRHVPPTTAAVAVAARNRRGRSPHRAPARSHLHALSSSSPAPSRSSSLQSSPTMDRIESWGNTITNLTMYDIKSMYNQVRPRARDLPRALPPPRPPRPLLLRVSPPVSVSSRLRPVFRVLFFHCFI